MNPSASRVAALWREARQPQPSDLRWKRTPEGHFSGLNGRALVDVRRKLVTVDGVEYKLPRKPSFGHAEGILKEHFGW